LALSVALAVPLLLYHYAGRHPELRIDVALTPEGMAGTSQDLPAAEAAAAGVLPCSSAFVVRPDI
jgi:hypothetical protein